MIDEAEEWTESTRPLASLTKYQAVVPLFPTFGGQPGPSYAQFDRFFGTHTLTEATFFHF